VEETNQHAIEQRTSEQCAAPDRYSAAAFGFAPSRQVSLVVRLPHRSIPGKLSAVLLKERNEHILQTSNSTMCRRCRHRRCRSCLQFVRLCCWRDCSLSRHPHLDVRHSLLGNGKRIPLGCGLAWCLLCRHSCYRVPSRNRKAQTGGRWVTGPEKYGFCTCSAAVDVSQMQQRQSEHNLSMPVMRAFYRLMNGEHD